MLEDVIEDAEEVGNIYANWSRKSEGWLIKQKGVEEEKGFTGRGQFARFETGPAFKRVSSFELTDGIEAQLWGSIEANLKRMQKGSIAIDEIKEFTQKKAEEIENLAKKCQKEEDLEEIIEL